MVIIWNLMLKIIITIIKMYNIGLYMYKIEKKKLNNKIKSVCKDVANSAIGLNALKR